MYVKTASYLKHFWSLVKSSKAFLSVSMLTFTKLNHKGDIDEIRFKCQNYSALSPEEHEFKQIFQPKNRTYINLHMLR